MNKNQSRNTYQLNKERVINFKSNNKILKRVATKLTFLKRKLILNNKIITIGNYSNLLHYNKITNIEKDITHSLALRMEEMYNTTTDRKIDYKVIMDRIILPDYLTKNNEWNNTILHLRKIGLNKSTVLIKKLELNRMNQYRHFSLSTLNYNTDYLKRSNTNNLIDNNIVNKEEFENESLRDVKVANLVSKVTTFNREVANSQYLLYHYSKINKNKYPFKLALHIIKLAFLSMGCLISAPKFTVVSELRSEDTETYYIKPQNKVKIKLFYFIKKDTFKLNIGRNRSKMNILGNYQLNLQYLTDYLANLFNSEIRLELIELKKPQYNSQILAQYLALKSYKYRFVKLIKTLFRGSNIEKPSNVISFCQGTYQGPRNSRFNLFPSFLAGVRIRLGGRTFKQKIIPRRTVQLIQKGTLNRAFVRYIEKARCTGKTRRGSYSFTITLGHVF